MIRLEAHSAGVVLPVRAQPRARRDEIRGEQDGALKVAVTQPAEKGKANKAIVILLAKSFQLRKSQFELLSGATSSTKKILIRGADLVQIRRMLAELNRPTFPRLSRP